MSKGDGVSGPRFEEPGPGSAIRKERQALVSKERQLVTRGSRLAERLQRGPPGTTWSRLNALDFMNSSMQFAALGILCLFHF